ncbi:D-xylulose kinase [Terriglobus roseus DSM 18391]|uniref:Xylulose kinase n=1 Tax=Terriglobus roseus (strain DSM 18391 / NRRL B-41598 / KBS 63) TaxID=926566 RepID=I3ZIG5_TERRK|nr:xylulokinase [Terriglobus roseus]AFL89033.1 D-xylulose kinase [Terriglobus roseus DSM 18391]
MMKPDLYLGIDCGTQGTKALLIGDDGTAHGRGYAKHDLIERANGAREQQPQWWVDALRTTVLQAAGNDGAQVKAIGVSGQQHGLVVLDENKEVIRPAKLWNDTETAPQNAELVKLLGGKSEAIRRFGILPLTGYTVSKLLWLREMEPENFARVRHILLPHEYLNFWLTGEIFAEYGDASGTAFFDVRTRGWIGEILDLIDGGTGQLKAALPPLLTVDQIVGKVKADVAAELGLSTDCAVSSGGGDNMMGAIGTGNVREGVVTLSLGTSSTVYSFREAPLQHPDSSVAPFCSSSGGWLPLVCTMNATNVVTQTLHLLGWTVDQIDPTLEDTVPGAEGITFLPFLNGERTPDLPGARGSIVGLNATNFTPANLVRSAIEGVTFGILNGLDLILEGKAATKILVIGGGARSSGWRQMLADATGATIQVPLEEEAGCLGAAIQAMYAFGQQSGRATTFAELTERLVQVDETKSASGRPEFLALYQAARQTYNAVLHDQYPELRLATT